MLLHFSIPRVNNFSNLIRIANKNARFYFIISLLQNFFSTFLFIGVVQRGFRHSYICFVIIIVKILSTYRIFNLIFCFVLCLFSRLLQKHGARMKCSSCKIVAHTNCIAVLIEKIRFTCKPTFRDVGIRQYREYTCIDHHWAHRRSQKGKCKQCGKVKYRFKIY